MSSTLPFERALAAFAAKALDMSAVAPQAVAVALHGLLVDATPVLSGLTRANWRFGVNAPEEGPVVRMDIEEYRRRQAGAGDPIAPPEAPTPAPANAGDEYYISNGTEDPAGRKYWPYILEGTPSQPRPWFRLALLEIETKAPAIIRTAVSGGAEGAAIVASTRGKYMP